MTIGDGQAANVPSKSVALNVTVYGTGTYRCEVRAERSVVSELVAGTGISVWVDLHHHPRTTLVGAAPTFDDTSGRGTDLVRFASHCVDNVGKAKMLMKHCFDCSPDGAYKI